MTWKEFKDKVESTEVEDDTEIGWIDINYGKAENLEVAITEDGVVNIY